MCHVVKSFQVDDEVTEHCVQGLFWQRHFCNTIHRIVSFHPVAGVH